MFAKSFLFPGCAALLLAAAISPRAAAAQTMSPADQLASAVLPLPKEYRDGAGVMGYKAAGKLETLKASKNGMMCLADDPSDDRFHVACYHESMEPFMARGRALRAGGTKGTAVDSVRFAEAKSGKIRMPAGAASLYSLTGPKGDYDAAKGTASKSRALFVVYVPGATEASTGLSTQSSDSAPWLMFPGTPKAHIMFTSSM